MRLGLRSLLVLAAPLAVASAVLLAPFGPGPAIVARITSDTHDGQLELFARSIERGELERARSLWIVPANASAPVQESLEARKREVLGELARFAGTRHVVQGVQWWGTCCMPHVIDSPTGAGGARYRVSFEGSSVQYVVDVFAVDTSWIHDRQPARGWAVRDVYHSGDPPLYFTASGY